MNVSKAEKYRYWICFFLENLEVGQKFQPSQLHLTVIPWFVTDCPDLGVIKKFQETFSDQQTLEIEIGEVANFHPNREIEVNLVEPNFKLERIHNIALKFFESLNGRWAVKNPYVDNEYKPHIRKREDSTITTRQLLKLSSIYLIKARREEDNIREVAARVSLSG